MPTFRPLRSRPLAARRPIALFLCACAALWAVAADATPARLKMSDLQAIVGSVSGYAVTPDGARAVYIADPEIAGLEGLFSVSTSGGTGTPLIESNGSLDRESLAISADGAHAIVIGEVLSDRDELYSVPLLGGPIVRLNPALPDGRAVRDFALAGARVVYRADQDTDNVEELYAVPITGGPVVKLSGALISGDVEDDYQVSPDGTRVVYRAAQGTAGVEQILSAPTDGSAPAVVLNGKLAGDGVRAPFVISPDGTRVVYRTDQDTSNVFELYSVPINGGAATKISGALVQDGDVSTAFRVDPNSSLVVYEADQDTHGVNDLYSVPLAGGTVNKLTDAYVAGGNLATRAWAISTQRVAFAADRDTDDVVELYSAPIGGGTVVKISGPMVDEGDVDIFDPPTFTGDGARVLYIADQIEDDREELFASLATGGGNVKLNGTLAGSSRVSSTYGVFDAASVWYQAAQDVENDRDLYIVPADGSVPATKVNGSLAPGGNVQEAPIITATQIVYRADQDTLGVAELFAADRSGGRAAIKLNDTITARGGRIEDALPTPDGQRVVYKGPIENPERVELFSAALDTGQITRLNTPLADDETGDLQLSNDGTRVLFLAAQDTRDITELYAVPVAGGSATKLNPSLVADGEVRAFVVSPSTDRVAYVADQDTADENELYAAAIAGGPVVKLNAPLPLDGDVTSSGLTISPDGGTTVYRADQNVDGLSEIFAVPTLGGPIVALSSPLTSAVGQRIAPDGSRVVYFADEDTSGVRELYAAPLAGGPSVKLNDPLPSGGRLRTGSDEYQITPDSTRVVYLGEQITDNVIELFSVPITGGVATRLNADLPGNADVGEFLLTLDGTRVIYRAEQETDNVFELYSVPVTGGTPVKLSPPLPPGGDVLRFDVSPTGDRVAFNGDIETNGIRDLFSAPVDGGAAAVKLNGSLAGSGILGSDDFAFTPDGQWVVYRTDQDTDGSNELYWVRATGGISTKVNGPLVDGGDVRTFWMAADSKSVFYAADEEMLGVPDLWYAQPLVSFDGFESGDTSGWSTAVP
ncbi:MAG: hypothetical protein AAF772_09355 [Acidobacteriota bacterium]